jgi:uncharacterized protein YgbK (DUF1537 family)
VLKFAIIADDLTGANDSGVQMAMNGFKTSVLLQMNPEITAACEVLVFDSDSRSVPAKDAYRKVKEIADFIEKGAYDGIFKKIDSTMRGNIGAEIDAVYDVFKPEFVIIAPGYPKNGRQIIDGYHYLYHDLLHETEVARDPKTPVTESYLPKMLQKQTKQPLGLITYRDLQQGFSHIKAMMDTFREKSTPYVVFDSKDEEDLRRIVEFITLTKYNVVWVGSAGLTNYLLPLKTDKLVGMEKIEDISLHGLVLLVVGSVSSKSRKQLQLVLEQPDIEGVQLNSYKVVSDESTRKQEIERVYQEVEQVIKRNKNVALYSSGSVQDIKKSKEIGIQHGYNSTSVSNMISKVLGEISARIIEVNQIQGIVATGGDTAKQVFKHFGADVFELIDEVEMGIPLGRIVSDKIIYAVTKAGSFGSDLALLHSMKLLQRDNEKNERAIP